MNEKHRPNPDCPVHFPRPVCPYDDKEIVGEPYRWPEEVSWLGAGATAWCSPECHERWAER